MAIETLRAAKRRIPEVARIKRARILDDLDAISCPTRSIRSSRAAPRTARRRREDDRTLPEGVEPIDGTIALWSELRFAARDEAVVHLEDLLLRRARLGLLAENGGMNEMPASGGSCKRSSAGPTTSGLAKKPPTARRGPRTTAPRLSRNIAMGGEG